MKVLLGLLLVAAVVVVGLYASGQLGSTKSSAGSQAAFAEEVITLYGPTPEDGTQQVRAQVWGDGSARVDARDVALRSLSTKQGKYTLAGFAPDDSPATPPLYALMLAINPRMRSFIMPRQFTGSYILADNRQRAPEAPPEQAPQEVDVDFMGETKRLRTTPNRDIIVGGRQTSTLSVNQLRAAFPSMRPNAVNQFRASPPIIAYSNIRMGQDPKTWTPGQLKRLGGNVGEVLPNDKFAMYHF